jgi:hypothetical protein
MCKTEVDPGRSGMRSQTAPSRRGERLTDIAVEEEDSHLGWAASYLLVGRSLVGSDNRTLG